MKKIISTLLVLAMVACMIPAFAVSTSAASATPEQGLNATFWHSKAEAEEGESGNRDAWRRAMAWNGLGNSSSYETNEWFDDVIDNFIKTSYKWPAVGNGTYTFGQGFLHDDYQATTKVSSGDAYMVKWEGTMKATTAGTYTFVANGLDNGVAIFVNEKKAFEWWGPDSWFDKSHNKDILSKYPFTVTEDQVGKDIPFVMWFLEMDADERLDMSITLDGTIAGQKSMEEAGLTFALSATYYTCLLNGEYDDITEHMVQGDGKDAGNPVNHTFSEDQLTAIKGEMINVGSAVISDMESDSFYNKPVFEHYFGAQYNGFMIEYDGYLTPTVTGEYQFGTHQVDNCFLMQLEINGEWKTVYEFWAKGIWNDNSTTYYNETFDLTAGTSYKLRAIFLELDGNEPLVTCYKINGEEFSYGASGIILTTEAYAPGTAPITNTIVEQDAEWKTTDVADSESAQHTVEFTIDDMSKFDGLSLMADLTFSNAIEVYLNDTLVYDYSRDLTSTTRYKLTEKVDELLKEGKNTITVILPKDATFSMSLHASNVNKDSLFPTYTAISTADEFIAYANLVNEFNAKDTNVTHCANVYITKDIDMSGKTYTPMGRFLGVIHGNGKTISNITYISDSAAGNKGLIVNDLANYWQNAPVESGTIKDLTVKNGLIVAPKTDGNAVGAIAGKMDRGCIYDCHVIDTTVIGGDWTGGIVGRSESGAINNAEESPVLNCSIKDSTIISTMTSSGNTKAVGGIVGTNDSKSRLLLGDYVIENVIIMCDESVEKKDAVVGAPDTTEGFAPVHGANPSVKNVEIVVTAAAAITEGAASTWTNTDATDVTITVSTTDNAITAVTVNGEALPSSYYTVNETAENSTEITLKKSYLQSLETGEYIVAVESYQGDVETTLTITNDDVQEAPSTGDAFLFIALIAVLSLAGVVFATKKRKSVK